MSPTGSPTNQPAPSVKPSPSAPSSPYGQPLKPVTAGRILFVSEGDGISRGQGGVDQPIYLDSTGLHLIPVAKPVDTSLAHAIWGPDDTILFDSERSGIRQIYRMDIDGSGVTAILGGAQSQALPSVDRDGGLVVYDNWINRATADQFDIDLGLHVARIDGTQPRAVTPGGHGPTKGGDTAADLSPDGNWVAFVRAIDVNADTNWQAGLFVIRTDGTGLRRLTSDASGADNPHWSPDGKHILFTGTCTPSDRGTAVRQCVIDAAGGPPRRLIPGDEPGTESDGDWSPDGSQVIFKWWKPGMEDNELRLVNADGSGLTTIYATPAFRDINIPDWGG